MTAITVSSLDMAEYFAGHGWDDILLAFIVNPLEVERLHALNARIRLHALVDSVAGIDALRQGLDRPIPVWLKIDVGYGRTGVGWDRPDTIARLVDRIGKNRLLEFQGVLTHSGQSYRVRGVEAIRQVYRQTVERLTAAQTAIHQAGQATCLISIGDTPTCSHETEFQGVDAIRPGNFVFYDLMMHQVGACESTQIAVAVACPVVGVYPERSEIVVYGGAVHLSKDCILDADGQHIFGRLMILDRNQFVDIDRNTRVVGLSQEHGTVRVHPEIIASFTPGDMVLIAPVHSCLTCDLYSTYRTLDGQQLSRL